MILTNMIDHLCMYSTYLPNSFSFFFLSPLPFSSLLFSAHLPIYISIHLSSYPPHIPFHNREHLSCLYTYVHTFKKYTIRSFFFSFCFFPPDLLFPSRLILFRCSSISLSIPRPGRIPFHARNLIKSQRYISTCSELKKL